jgi:hypothetical protein
MILHCLFAPSVSEDGNPPSRCGISYSVAAISLFSIDWKGLPPTGVPKCDSQGKARRSRATQLQANRQFASADLVS